LGTCSRESDDFAAGRVAASTVLLMAVLYRSVDQLPGHQEFIFSHE
jgi:hypothetical protein